MEGCDLPVILGKDLGGAGPQHQQWPEFGSAHHLPTTPDDTESTAAAQLGNERASFCERLPGSAAAAAACSPEPSSKEISCNDFAASFPSLQAYMEPPCASAHPLLPSQEDCGSDTGEEEEEEEEEESDIENLAGEIVYQPDGSAYIVESLSQLSQGGGGLPPLLANSALAIPGAKSGDSAAAVPQVYPQIINTFHIASSFGKWFEGPDEAFPGTSALVGVSPVLHSFRVFDVRHRSNRDYLNSDGSAKSSCVSKDVPNNVDMSKFDSFVLYGKRKPILMCFLCKLSFGFVRSLVSHAVHDHRMTLSEEERRILSNKNISAIIQGIGKDKEPLVSFLEPKNKNVSHPLVSATDLISPGHSFYGKFSGIHMEGEGGAQTGAASTSDQPQAADLLAPGGLLNLGGLTSSALKTPITSVPLDAPSSSPSAASSEGKGPGGPGSDAQGSSLAKAELPGEDQEEEEEEEEEEGAGGGGQGLFPHRLEQDPEEKLPATAEPGLAAHSGSRLKDLALSNQSISPLMPHVLQGVSRGLAPSAAPPPAPPFVFDGANRRSCLSFNREGSQRAADDTGEESANRDDAPELRESPEGEDGLCLPHHQHGGPLCDLGGEGCPSGGGVECPKCDTVLGSSRSLGGHMTMMHSRNSCKTLKCPKCNWHYKYQQTLEAHMKEKHPEPGGTCAFCQSGQLHPRLARGESYTCGYKPFRCEVCNYSTTTKGNLSIHMQSDKHLNNMQTLQNGSGEQGFSHAAGAVAVATAAATSIGGGCGAPSPTKPKSKPSWRCEVCDYETNVARNLRIHMTSEKHMHNMVLFQQKSSQVPLGLDGLSAEAELYNYYLGQNLNMDHSPASEAQFLTGSHFQVEPSHTLASVAPSLVGGETPLEPPLGGGQLVPEELVNLGETVDQSSDPSRKLFQCAMCNKFTTDALDLLGLHLNAERALPEEEWKGAVGEAYQCRLCHYSTQLKANFQLHCKTEKHLQKYQLVAHIREGGKANEWRLKCMVMGNPLHLKCNACDYYTNSLEKLRLHTGNYRHEASLKLYKHLQKHESRLEGDSCFYHCVLCNYSTKAKLNLVQHVRSLKHQRTESLHKLKRLQKSLPEEEEDLGQIFTIQHCPAADIEELIGDAEGLGEVATSPDEAAKEVESVADQDQATWAAEGPQAEKEPAEPSLPSKHPSFSRHSASPVPRWPTPSEEAKLEQVYHCLYCKYSNPDVNRLRVHVVTQHSIQPMLRCPLCQDLLSNKLHLKLHLTHLHSVSPDCVEKLLLTVTTPEAVMPSNVFPTAAAAAADRDGNEEPLQPPESSEEGGKGLRLLPEAVRHGGSSGGKPAASEQPGAGEEETGFFCWKKGCGQGFRSSSALQAHFGETHGRRPQLPVSDRHVYKYRCNQCSLAFKTVEKLQLHSQYHAIRAATMCCLCQRSFRTFQALRKHLEASHLDLSEADIQQLYSGLLVNGELLAVGDLPLAEDHPVMTTEEEEKEEENSDQEDKQSPAGSDCGSLQEDSGSEPKRALPFRKGPNFTLEKFLDPARPYKCTVCKESFTQKNILLVHYNSVSHLHKLKRALQESSASQSEATSSPDHKPFKCSICSVAYSQSSTLEIHMRSVLHQTKARAAKLEAVSGSGHSSASLGSSMPSPLGAGTTSLTSSSSSAAPQSNISTGSTGSTLPLLSQASCDPTGQLPLNLPIRSSHSPAAPLSPSEPKETNRKKPGDAPACRQPLPPPPNSLMQAQLQQELQQQASLLQAQLFSPALLPHFPMVPEALLQQQQQQQLLFPFYFPSAELQLNAEVSLPMTNGTLTLGLLEDLKPQLPQPSHPQMQQPPLPLSQPPCVPVPPSVAPDKKAKSVAKEKEAQREQEMAEKGGRSPSCQEPLPEASKAQEKADPAGPTEAAGSSPEEAPWLPPRIAVDARGNATKALLENFGFELVIQYNENKQKAAGRVEQGIGLERLECESCSKFFSNVLILKTHQEHVHQHYLPFQQLESFAQQYREHYDQLYPLRSLTPEPAPPPPPAPAVTAAPPQPPSTPTLQVSASPMTSPSLAPNQPPLPHTQPLPLPMELPLFSPLMMPTMPLQALPAQLPPQLAPVDSLPAELAQLYQHQLNQGLLQQQQQQQQQQQNKRPRTRITDEQLRVLRQYFDINNSPSEEQIKEMAEKSGLPQKVIKHWFRNTLFKERQRNKDSPYNFSNPPITSLEDLKVDSRPSSPEPQKHEYWGSKRSSRTRFTDYQLRVLQDFFDANAYPKDDEFEQLSNLLNLPTRVIVVWFQNARQKARKNYENQGEGKEGERRELTNDRYIRTSNLNYQCKKCSLVFQRIFDLIKHQKKLCYKDEDEDGQEDSQNEDSMDATELLTPSSSSCSTPMPSQAYGTPTSSASAAFPSQSTTEADSDCPAACQPKANAADEKPKHPEPSSAAQQSPASDKQRQPKRDGQVPAQDQEELKLSSVHPKASPPLQQQPAHPLQGGPPQASPPPAQLSHLPHKPLATPIAQQLASLPPQLVPYQCKQCKLAFPSFEHWQEHQQLHFLSTQGQFLHPQFDLPFMLFDPSNPLLASQLLSGTLSQLPMSSATSPSTPTATMSSLKRKLEEKARVSPVGNDGGAGGEEPQRDKRLRTTITPEQLEVLYQKYLLDSNPTRKMLDHIAHEVGLKKRVVQVWFQNTRARERKGQFRAVGPAQAHRRCPFCRALFKAKTALEAHIRSRHWHEAKRAGYNLALSAMLLDCEGGGGGVGGLLGKGDLFDGANFAQLSAPGSSSDSQGIPLSPGSKSLELSPQTLLSPSSIKVEGVEDLESPSVSSVHLSFDQAKLDNDDCSSVNTALTDTTTGDETNADNDSATGVFTEARGSLGPSEGLTKAAMLAMSEYEDRLSSGLVSPAPSFHSKEYDNEGTVDYSETSSLADPCSPSPGTSGSAGKSGDGGDRPGQKRFRTQMTNLQLKVLKACFSDYRTPTMLECEVLGNDIGLPKRVIQVWFQNARAKEKKAKLNMAKHFGINQSGYEGPKTECTLCGIKYGARLSVRDHIFSEQHISKVKETVGSQLDKEKEYFDPATVRQLMAQQELDRLKKANEALGLAAQQQGMFDSPPLQALNIPASYPAALQSIPPVLLPGLNSPSLPGFTPSNTALTSPKPALMGLPGTSVPSPGLPTSGSPNKTAPLSSPPPAQTSVGSTTPLPLRKDKESEKAKEKERPSKTRGEALSGPKKDKGEAPNPGPAFPAMGPALEYSAEPTQLQALQAALNTESLALLTNPFLPCFVPGFSPYYAPQLPGALQSGYLQPMYSMEGVFPYGPALSQALLGVSPGSLLQHYQQYQQSLQEALQRQVQLPLPKGSQPPVPTEGLSPEKGPAKESPRPEEKSSSRQGSPRRELATAGSSSSSSSAPDSLWDPFIVPPVQYRLVCRKCQAGFGSQEAADVHLKSLCCFGQSMGTLPEMALQVLAGGGGSYQCVACESTVCGEEALQQHLESAPHRQHQTVPRAAARNAKEPPSQLPHSACLPDPSTASTSQPTAHPKNGPLPAAAPHSSKKPWPPAASPPGKPPPLSSSSTVTSSSCSTSGVQPSLMPRKFSSEESDSGRGPEAGAPLEPSSPRDGGLPSVDPFRL
ncbi:PREDICTED: zinc finger homeobox protein 3-like [Thamnophis sirtalis]|uniref:Zinc finger homeobox protein 3 n=1 Tax=Thamnophis sirtalis TaxID=35019 RepID=A0A6I9XGP8_9SAUR|nr:PREDICTED: zinc finger homeobox protein 3-like [Thamnophis sirtalis]